MSEISAVLLVPKAGDPGGLLKDGPCGSRPPVAVQNPKRPGRWKGATGLRTPDQRGALVLVWRSLPVPQSYAFLPPGKVRRLFLRTILKSDSPRTREARIELRATMHEIGRLIFLGRNGKEVDGCD